MASTDFYTSLQTTKASVLDIPSSYSAYKQSLASQNGSIVQGGEMGETVQGLQAELRALQSANSTYNREYQDRVDAGIGIVARPGFQTTQDYALAWFFGTYLLLVVLLCLYMLLRTQQKLYNMTAVLGIGVVFGLITMHVIIQLA